MDFFISSPLRLLAKFFIRFRLPAFPTEIAFSVIEEELGRPVKELFLEISERPIAAASLGQV